MFPSPSDVPQPPTCSELFRFVFHFIHKQHPTVITLSVKYQRAPSWESPCSGPNLPPGEHIPEEEEEEEEELYKSFFSTLPRLIPSGCLTQFAPNTRHWFSERIKQQEGGLQKDKGHIFPLLPSQPLAFLVTLGLRYTATDIITHPPDFTLQLVVNLPLCKGNSPEWGYISGSFLTGYHAHRFFFSLFFFFCTLPS